MTACLFCVVAEAQVFTIRMMLYGDCQLIVREQQLFEGNLLIFELGCIISAVAQQPCVFIIGRALSGLGVASVLTDWVV